MVSGSEEGEARRMDSGNRGPTDLAVTGEFGDLGTELLHRTLHSEKHRQVEEAEDLEVSACASGNRLGGQSVRPASEPDYGRESVQICPPWRGAITRFRGRDRWLGPAW